MLIGPKTSATPFVYKDLVPQLSPMHGPVFSHFRPAPHSTYSTVQLDRSLSTDMKGPVPAFPSSSTSNIHLAFV
ncbi:hypothetical protein CPB84DRAFT_1762768, partial [Gymnopilus junonius]